MYLIFFTSQSTMGLTRSKKPSLVYFLAKMEISSRMVEQVERILKPEPNIIAGYLFGSRMSNYAASKSDLDLALVVSDPKKAAYEDLYLKIAKVFSQELDLRIIHEETSPFFIFQVLKTGKLLYQKTERERVQFETKALREFYDSEYTRSIYDHYLKESLEKGGYGHR